MTWKYPAPRGRCNQCNMTPWLVWSGGERSKANDQVGVYKCPVCDARYDSKGEPMTGGATK